MLAASLRCTAWMKTLEGFTEILKWELVFVGGTFLMESKLEYILKYPHPFKYNIIVGFAFYHV